MIVDRRSVILGGAGILAASAFQSAAAAATSKRFPSGFLWGAATSGHQTEGNNVASDTWFLEHVQSTAFAEPSADACNSFELWPLDLDLVRGLGLNSYRFSIEWSRIEPEQGKFSVAMLDHYARIIDGCHERGLTPLVTFNHFTCPRWFGAAGGWSNPEAPGAFARYCEFVARRVAARIGYAVTLNEPNLMRLLRWLGLPQQVFDGQRAMLAAAAKALGVPKFSTANTANLEDLDAQLEIMLKAHKAAREAIKSVAPNLPVGVSLAISDDQAVGSTSKRDEKRADCYGAWLDAAKQDDFIGVQNYDRQRFDATGSLPVPKGAAVNWLGAELYPPSLGGAVRYAHEATGKPVLVTEHGLGIEDDALRAAFIPKALEGLKAAMDAGVPVKGYVHWSLLDNFEWTFGYRPRFGLFAVDRQTFKRTAKPSAAVYAAIAARNAL
jgi:beta-glucosidase